MSSQNLAAIHALTYESSQWIANREIQPLNVCSIDLSSRINTKQLHYLLGITVNNTLYYLNESSILFFLADFCILQVRVRNKNWVWLPSDSTIWRCLKKTVDIEKSFFEWVPVVRSEYWNRWIDCSTFFYVIKKFESIICSSLSFMMA